MSLSMPKGMPGRSRPPRFRVRKTQADDVDAIWQDGEDGFLIIGVRSHGLAEIHLNEFAGNIVPDFALIDQAQ